MNKAASVPACLRDVISPSSSPFWPYSLSMALASQRDVIWANENMRIESKMKIYKACIRPTAAHGIKTCIEMHKMNHILRAAEIQTLMTFAGNALRDRMNNNSI